MDALRKQIQSLTNYVMNHCFWTYEMLSEFDNDRRVKSLLEVIFGLLLYQREV